MTSNEFISAGIAAAAALGLALREYLKREKVGNAQDSNTVQGLNASDKVVGLMREELNRLAQRVDVLEGQVDELSGKLASVRVIAVDCYALAIKCQCPANDDKTALLANLKQIIRDA